VTNNVHITIAMMLPSWWGMGLLALTLLGDLLPGLRPRVSRLFGRLDHQRPVTPDRTGAQHP